jgi:hypothetical protein
MAQEQNTPPMNADERRWTLIENLNKPQINAVTTTTRPGSHNLILRT